MSNETIMLAKVAKRKLIDPEAMYEISEKLDGQPVYIPADFSKALSRQGKEVTSIEHILEEFRGCCEIVEDKLHSVDGVVGELYIKGEGSAEISGHVRKNAPCERLCLYLFPEFVGDYDDGFSIKDLKAVRVTGARLLELLDEDDTIRIGRSFHDEVYTCRVNSHESPFFEGYIARKVDTPWISGKRSNDYLKLIEEPTMDMKVVGFEEAHSKAKEPLGRVGAFIVEWVDEDGTKTTTKVSKGKLTNGEATVWWYDWKEGNLTLENTIIEVKYKRDAKYTVPRQPTFQRFRDDKTTYQNSFKGNNIELASKDS